MGECGVKFERQGGNASVFHGMLIGSGNRKGLGCFKVNSKKSQAIDNKLENGIGTIEWE
jgi:hypothetical protein